MKALVVCEDQNTRYLYRVAIAYQKFVVTTAKTIKEAVSKISRDWPDIMVIDIDERGLSALEHLKTFKPKNKNLPVIILTDMKSSLLKKKVCVLGVCHFISRSESSLGDLIKMSRKVLK